MNICISTSVTILYILGFISLSVAKNGTDKDDYAVLPVSIQVVPYHVQVVRHNHFTCSGSIISEDFVLTAAHCTYHINISHIIVLTGAELRYNGERVKIAATYTHPKYVPNKLSYDISIIKLATLLEFRDGIKPIKLPSAGYFLALQESAVASGWGEGKKSAHLKLSIDQIIDIKYCRKSYGEILGDDIMCSGRVGRKCVADPGSALIKDGIEYGVASRCNTDGLTIYSNLTKSMNFIRKKITRYAATKNYPYLVQIRDDKGKYLCSGAIIAKNWVITSTICTVNYSPKNLVIRANAEFTKQRKGKNYKVKAKNEYFDYVTTLLELEKALVLGPYMKTVKIAKILHRPHLDTVIRAAGWKASDRILRSVELQVTRIEKCTTTRRNNDHVICFAVRRSDEEGCNGYLGSPIVVNGTLYGMISAKIACDWSERLVISTNIVKFYDFMSKKRVNLLSPVE